MCLVSLNYEGCSASKGRASDEKNGDRMWMERLVRVCVKAKKGPSPLEAG